VDINNPDKAEFLRLYTPIQPKLFSFILAMIHNRKDAEELFQETSVILWDKYDKFNGEMIFDTWAIGIARNKVLEYLRQNKKQKKMLSDKFYLEISGLAEKSLDDVHCRIEALKSCVEKLNLTDRRLLSMHYYQNKSVRDISQEIGRSTNSLYKSFVRIIVLLRGCIHRQLEHGVIHEV
jgi:RNA polymerase sigma-70 factor (ECF subfamily)